MYNSSTGFQQGLKCTRQFKSKIIYEHTSLRTFTLDLLKLIKILINKYKISDKFEIMSVKKFQFVEVSSLFKIKF